MKIKARDGTASSAILEAVGRNITRQVAIGADQNNKFSRTVGAPDHLIGLFGTEILLGDTTRNLRHNNNRAGVFHACGQLRTSIGTWRRSRLIATAR